MFIFRRKKSSQFVINSNLSFDNWVFFVFLIVTDISEIQSQPFKLSGYFVLGRDELCWSLTDDGGTNRSLSNAFFIIFNLCADSCDPDFFFASWKVFFSHYITNCNISVVWASNFVSLISNTIKVFKVHKQTYYLKPRQVN